MVASKKIYSYPNSENVTLFGKRIFSDGIKDFNMRFPWIIQMGPKPNGKYPYRDRRGEHTEIRDDHVKMEAEIGISEPKAKELLVPPKLEEARKDFLESFQRGHGPANTLILYFQFPEP